MPRYLIINKNNAQELVQAINEEVAITTSTFDLHEIKSILKVPKTITNEQMLHLAELTFHGRTCTKDCSGHAAGYLWGIKHKVQSPEPTHSPSFTSGTDIAATQIKRNKIVKPRVRDQYGKYVSGPKNYSSKR